MADATDKNGNAEALEIPISLLPHYILLQGTAYTLVSLSSLADSNVSGNVKFSATSSESGDTLTFAESNLPAGLSSGNPALSYLGGTAAPGTYSGAVVTATDSDGAALKGTFDLTVEANAVSGSYGDEVNRFGTGSTSSGSTRSRARLSPDGPPPRATRRLTSFATMARIPVRSSSSTRPRVPAPGSACPTPAAAGHLIRCVTA